MSLWQVKRGGQPYTRSQLEQWQVSPRAQRLQALEARELALVLPEVFGRHVVQLGNWGAGEQLIESAATLHRAVGGSLGGALQLDPESLPFAAKSVDALVLPHTLEFTRSPHNVLREVDRVLSDRGRLFILGYNPYGAWAMRGWLGLRAREFLPGARHYSVGRLGDWLELLDFEVMQVRRFGVGFPWLATRSLGESFSPASLLAPFAEAYLLVAKKRVLPMNFVGRLPRAQVKTLVPMPVPAARNQPSAFEPPEKT